MNNKVVLTTHCPCGTSSDAFKIYEDGSGACYSGNCPHRKDGMMCAHFFKDQVDAHLEGNTVEVKEKETLFLKGFFTQLKSRAISKETCEFFGYEVAKTDRGEFMQVANFFNDKGDVVGQQWRSKEKDFITKGDTSTLYGKHLWKKGKYIVITEGQIDCLSLAQTWDCKYPVVSVPQGVNSAKKSIQKDLDWLEKNFEEIILFFDGDEAGQKAAIECASLFYPGKCSIYTPDGYKDANEMLIAGEIDQLKNCVFRATPFQPQGITTISQVRKSLNKPIERGLSYPWPKLSELTFGIRLQELIFLGAGTGMGKTEVYKEVITHLRLEHRQKIGVLFLEESNEHTARCLAGKAISKPLHIPTVAHTQEEIDHGLDLIAGSDEIIFYNHFGYQDYESVKSAIKYMVTAMDCKYIFLDHITALVSGDYESDERKLLDYICTDLASMVRRYNFTIFAISHLATAAGVPHEEGGRVQLKHLRGSRAIGQWANFVFALEKDQQDPTQKNQVLFRVLKDRLTGQSTGETFLLHYNPDTGRITETPTTDFGEPIDLF